MSTTPTLTRFIASMYEAGIPGSAHMILLHEGYARTGVLIPETDWASHMQNGIWNPLCEVCSEPIFDGQVHRFDDNDKPYLSAEEWAQFHSGCCEDCEFGNIVRP